MVRKGGVALALALQVPSGGGDPPSPLGRLLGVGTIGVSNISKEVKILNVAGLNVNRPKGKSLKRSILNFKKCLGLGKQRRRLNDKHLTFEAVEPTRKL